MSQKAIKESIQHWKRMLKWAKKQPPRQNADDGNMYKAIRESWFDDSCSLCQEHVLRCKECELGDCEDSNGVWRKVDTSYTWLTWCKNAELMIKRLEGLLKPEKKNSKRKV